jgi:signal transduction histidine kinase/ActR/RegA family two-component response regulator
LHSQEVTIARTPDIKDDEPAAATTGCDGFRRLGQVTVIAAALALIALTWIGARDAIQAHRTEAEARVQAETLGKALSFEELLRREMLSLDQTLRILEYDWQRDPTGFDMAARSAQLVSLNDVSLQIFIADAQGIVRSSSRAAIIGADVSGRDYFRHEAALPTDDGRMFVGALTQGLKTRIWQINLVRRLDTPDGRFAGVIAASYDMNSFSRFYREVDLGSRGLVAVVSATGDSWTLPDPAQSATVVSIAGSTLFAAMQAAPDGGWTGGSPLDATERVYAFATVPDRDLKVVVGVVRAEAMGAAELWERNALIFAGGITLLVLLMVALLLREENAVRRRHESLAHERAVLEATITGMGDGIMMVDGDLRLVAWNQHFAEFTGVPAHILRVGLPMEDILRGQAESGEFGAVDVEAEVARRMALLRSGAAMGTIERPRPSGLLLEIRRNPLPGGGFVTLYTDVTARRETEERLRQAQTMAAVGRLTAGVAHDFNNLLIAISGNAEMLRNQLSEHPRHVRRLAVIMQATGRGSDLVRQLLAFSRKQPPTPVQVDLNRIVRGMDDLLHASLGRTTRVETKLAEDLWPTLVDPVQIEHVILNLAINARDAMPDGGKLTIATSNVSLGPFDRTSDMPPGDYVVVAVSDTGTGMSDEVVRSAFEPFFTTKPPGQGSGLGLSQVFGVASQSGGGVRIESAVDVGTTVSVFFPRIPADVSANTGDAPDSHKADPAPVGQPTPDARRNRTVLVVDDEADCRDTIAAMLSANGFSIVAADSGNEAMRQIEQGLTFDLLLVEFALPDMNGIELAQAVRARWPSFPVVFSTGGDSERIAGERWVLTKPFRMRALIDTVRAALGQARGTDAARRSNTQAG